MRSAEHGSRILVGGGVLAAVLIALLTWFVVVSPVRADTETLREDTASVETQNLVLQARTVALAKQAEDRGQLVTDARQALAGLPPGTQLPGFNRQLARQARARGVDLTSISVGASTTGATTPGQAVPTSTLTIPVTIQSTGTLVQQLAFLRDLQQVGPRRALVASTSLAPGQVGSSLEMSSVMTVQLSVFSAPMSAEARAELTGVLHAGRSG